MILDFKKTEEGNISVIIEGKEFTTKDYISMIKEVRDGNEIEVKFSDDIDEGEKESINSMLKQINDIGKQEDEPEMEEEVAEDISADDDLPF